MDQEFLDACENGDFNKVKELLPEIRDLGYLNEGLVLACYKNGNLNIVKLLVENGADITHNRNESILTAMGDLNIDIVLFLLSLNIYDLRDESMTPVLYLFGEYSDEYPQVFKYPFQHHMLGFNDRLELSKILYGACKGMQENINSVHYLVFSGADVNYENINERESCLSIAVTNGHLQIVKHLVQYDADINWRDSKPLTSACRHNKLEILKYFFSQKYQKVDPNFDNGYGMGVAAYFGHVQIVNFLLSKGADPSINDLKALNEALENNQWNVIEVIIKHLTTHKISKETKNIILNQINKFAKSDNGLNTIKIIYEKKMITCKDDKRLMRLLISSSHNGAWRVFIYVSSKCQPSNEKELLGYRNLLRHLIEDSKYKNDLFKLTNVFNAMRKGHLEMSNLNQIYQPHRDELYDPNLAYTVLEYL